MISFWQTKFQLVSPLIPTTVVDEISEPYWKASMIVSITFIVALWLYFFKKRIAAIIVSGTSIVAYQFIVQIFFQ
jgi:hypothetical protein